MQYSAIPRLSCAILLSLLPPASAFNYGSIPASKMPPNGWINSTWGDPGGWTTLDVTDHGVPVNNPSVDASVRIKNLINSTSGFRILYFPAGTYYLKSSLTVTVGGIRFQGAGMGSTFLRLDTPSDVNSSILFAGSGPTGSELAVNGSIAAGTTAIPLLDASSIAAGDIIYLYARNAPLENDGNAWNWYVKGQFVKVNSKSGNTLNVDMKIGLSYPSSEQPRVKKYNFIHTIGIETLRVVRVNDTQGITNVFNVVFRYAKSGFMRDMESEYCVNAHLVADRCRDIVFERNKVHEKLSQYSGMNGFGYGIALQGGTTNCRVTDNKTWNVRHHIMLQQGANHNVVSYNSNESTWMDYNDMALHATYAYQNLFEGNSFREGYADGSKPGADGAEDSTGPGNTWFRNNAKEDIGSLQSTTKLQNLIGNVCLDLDTWGSDHYIGANRVNGSIQWGALSSSSSIPASLYLTSKPGFFGSKPWPLFGPGVGSAWGQANTLPATERPR